MPFVTDYHSNLENYDSQKVIIYYPADSIDSSTALLDFINVTD